MLNQIVIAAKQDIYEYVQNADLVSARNAINATMEFLTSVSAIDIQLDSLQYSDTHRAIESGEQVFSVDVDRAFIAMQDARRVYFDEIESLRR